MMKSKLILDLECYPNYFLVASLDLESNQVKTFELNNEKSLDIDEIESLLSTHEIITFNGNRYDMPLLTLAMSGADNTKLKYANDEIIKRELTQYQFYNRFNLQQLDINHIDLIEVIPGKASLKIYGGRLHCNKMQDLPYEPDKILTRDEQSLVKAYCGNDLEVTKLLYTNLVPQIDLRRKLSNQYKMDLRSKSDSQIAEAVITAELRRKIGNSISKPPPMTSFLYKMPEFIKPTTDWMDDAIKIVTTKPFSINNNGQIEMTKELISLQLKRGQSVYQMGMGGLHSNEQNRYFIANNKTILRDSDVASYYPSIILNCELYPKQLGKSFLDVYKQIVDTRLAAKASGDKVTADSLKITINGSFGKLGSKYSNLYSPDLMIQVTVTGQLALLSLIDALENESISVISANTDGIVTKFDSSKEPMMMKIISDWEQTTGFVMEHSDYSAVYSRDVNNYIATTTNNKVKVKGCYKPGDFQKNPRNEICNEAAVQYLLEGKDIEETIIECKDITKFLTVQAVKGGAVKDKKELGKAIRWYYAKGSFGTINYKTNGNMVPRTTGAKPLMDLPKEFPSDINYQWYVNETKDLICDVGLKIKGQLDLF